MTHSSHDAVEKVVEVDELGPRLTSAQHHSPSTQTVEVGEPQDAILL